MSEGKWVAAKFRDIREGDTVRVICKAGPQTTITEGMITRCEKLNGSEIYWTIEDYENFYDYEFIPDSDGDCSALERLVPPFQWPSKLGAVVTFTEGGTKHKAVLIEESLVDPEDALWWTMEWGNVNKCDLSDVEDLTVIHEGVTVEA